MPNANEIDKLRRDLAAKRRRRLLHIVEPEKTPPAGLKTSLYVAFRIDRQGD